MRSEPAAVGVPASPPGTGGVPRGEVDAVFSALFIQHRHRVFSTALRLTGRRADAEDLTADTFLQAYRSLSGFDFEGLDTLRPRAWLSAIVVNLWRTQGRASSRRPRPALSPEAMGPGPVYPHPEVEQQIETREDGGELAAALLALPERQRGRRGSPPHRWPADCRGGRGRGMGLGPSAGRLPGRQSDGGCGGGTVPVSPVGTTAVGHSTRAPVMTGSSGVGP